MFDFQEIRLLAKTVLLELPIFYILLRKKPVWLVVVFSILLNCFTQPIAYFLYNGLDLNFYLTEALVFVTEAILIKVFWKIRWWEGLFYSLLCNVYSAFFYFLG
jgi:hypothetical protein